MITYEKPNRDNKGRFIKGHKQSNTGKTHFKKGIQYRLGKKLNTDQCKKLSKAHIGMGSGNKNPNREGRYATREVAV